MWADSVSAHFFFTRNVGRRPAPACPASRLPWRQVERTGARPGAQFGTGCRPCFGIGKRSQGHGLHRRLLAWVQAHRGAAVTAVLAFTSSLWWLWAAVPLAMLGALGVHLRPAFGLAV